MMYEDGFNIEEWKEKKLAERQETFAAQEEALKDVFAGGQTLANYFYQRGRLGSHITAGNTALILRANPLACAVMSADDWSKYGRRVSKGFPGGAGKVGAPRLDCGAHACWLFPTLQKAGIHHGEA